LDNRVAMVGVPASASRSDCCNRTAAILTPLLIILNGGLGWTMLFSDIKQRRRHLSKFCGTCSTPTPSFLIWPRAGDGEFNHHLLIPQRGFLLGIPLAVIVFTLWWQSMTAMAKSISTGKVQEPGDKSQINQSQIRAKLQATGITLRFALHFAARMLAAGVIAGMLPLIHAHSFIATMGVAGVLALINIKKWREWLAFIVVASVIAIPQMLWSTHGSAVSTKAIHSAGKFGWGHANENVFWFWFKNTGFFIPLLVAALALEKLIDTWSRASSLLFYLPFTLCFIVPNMVKLAPWIWDNIKILFYWWIASAPIVALLLAKLVGRRFSATGFSRRPVRHADSVGIVGRASAA
jgi:hypothetical protein